MQLRAIWTKGFWLFWIDAICALSLLGLMISGAVLAWYLPHGGGGRGRGRVAQTLVGLNRHEWGDLHFWVSVAFVTGIAVHLMLHVGWIKAAGQKYLGLKYLGLQSFRRSRQPENLPR